MSVHKTNGKREDGQGIVEFALVIVVLFLVVFAVFEFARVFFAYATMSQGVREAARYGIVEDHAQNTDDIIDVARSRMALIGSTAEITVTYYPDPFATAVPPDLYCTHDCSLQVRATSHYDPWTPFIPGFDIVAQSTMHFE